MSSSRRGHGQSMLPLTSAPSYEPHGFGGLLGVPKRPKVNDLARSERPEVGHTLLGLDAAVRPPHVPTEPDENAISQVDELLDAGVTSPRLRNPAIEGDRSLSTVHTLLGPADIGPNRDVRVDHLGKVLPITASEG